MNAQEGSMLFSGGLYAVQVGYMDVQEVCILFRGITYIISLLKERCNSKLQFSKFLWSC